jgi:hypothetical protein
MLVNGTVPSSNRSEADFRSTWYLSGQSPISTERDPQSHLLHYLSVLSDASTVPPPKKVLFNSAALSESQMRVILV